MKQNLIMLTIFFVLTACGQAAQSGTDSSPISPTNTQHPSPTVATQPEEQISSPSVVIPTENINYSGGISGLVPDEAYTVNWYHLENIPTDPKYDFAMSVMEFVEQSPEQFGITGTITSNTFIIIEGRSAQMKGAELVVWEEEGKLISQATLITSINIDRQLALVSPTAMGILGIDSNGYHSFPSGKFEDIGGSIGVHYEREDGIASLVRFITIESSENGENEVFWVGGSADNPLRIGTLKGLNESGINLSGLFEPREYVWEGDLSFPEGVDVSEYLVEKLFYENQYLEAFSELKIGNIVIDGEQKEAIIGVGEGAAEIVLAAQMTDFEGETRIVRVSEYKGEEGKASYIFVNPNYNLDGYVQPNEDTARVFYEYLYQALLEGQFNSQGSADAVGELLINPQRTIGLRIPVYDENYTNGDTIKWETASWDPNKPVEILIIDSQVELEEMRELLGNKLLHFTFGYELSPQAKSIYFGSDGHMIIVIIDTRLELHRETFERYIVGCILNETSLNDVDYLMDTWASGSIGFPIFSLFEVLSRVDNPHAFLAVITGGVRREWRGILENMFEVSSSRLDLIE